MCIADDSPGQHHLPEQGHQQSAEIFCHCMLEGGAERVCQ